MVLLVQGNLWKNIEINNLKENERLLETSRQWCAISNSKKQKSHKLDFLSSTLLNSTLINSIFSLNIMLGKVRLGSFRLG